jgi:rubrerythrin
MAILTATTNENLKAAFAGESQANQKYRAFAKKAEQDGLPNIARLFRTTAEAERIHAEGHLKALEAIGSSVDNLQAAIGGETYEFTDMYPPMLAQAEIETHKAQRMFGYAVKAEEVHARIYQLALESAQQGKDMAQAEFYLCPVCGYIELGQPTEDCPICGTKAGKFTLVE